MKILIIGGTLFLGRHLVEAAQARGHVVTLFNRGKTNPDLFPDVEKLHGDRDGNLEALRDRHWDAAIDVAGMLPRHVRATAQLLANAVKHYTCISTVSVYANFSKPGMDESALVGKLSHETVEQITGETYGPLKALCERAAQEAMPGRVLIIRPGLIVGPHDNSDRFTYWVRRIKQGGEVLAPGNPDRQVTFIDARDLAEWTIRMIEANRTGVYNALGPNEPITLRQVLETCKAVSGSDANFIWMDDKFLLDNDAQPWMEIPLWIPDIEEEKGFFTVDFSKAIADGLTSRPLESTIRDIVEWDTARSAHEPTELKAGLKAQKEAALLQTWHQHHNRH